MPDTLTLSDEDRFNIVLQMLMRCCVQLMRKILPNFVRSLGYANADIFLSSERANIERMPSASLSKSKAILYPGTPTDIELWDFSQLNCIFTLIQRRIILQEFGNPIDLVLIKNRAHVIATSVGRANEEKLFPTSGKQTDINKWSMPVCSCLLSLLSPKPQTLLVRIAESLDDVRELRNGLCHPEDPAMTSVDYERNVPLLKTFIESGFAYLGDDAFETEIRKDMDEIENGKIKHYLLIAHTILQQSYKDGRDFMQRLDKIEKASKESPRKAELNLQVFFGQLPREQMELLCANFIETFNECLEKILPESVENEELKQQTTLASCMAWKILSNPLEGRHVLGVRRKYVEVKIGFDNALWMWSFIKDYLYGRLESAFEPMQKLLRKREGCENLEITVAIPDMFTALMQTGQAVEMDIDSIMFMLEMMFQKSRPLHLEVNYTDVCNRRTRSSQLQIKNAGIQTEEIESEGPEETFVEKTERLSVEICKWPSEEFYLDGSGQKRKALPLEECEESFEVFTIDESGRKDFYKGRRIEKRIGQSLL